MQKLPRSFYDRDTTQVARELLGKLLVHEIASLAGGRVWLREDVEAYAADWRARHPAGVGS